MEPNPTWFVGNGWRFGPKLSNLTHRDADVNAELRLYCENGSGVTLQLTDAQIAKLQYAGQVGELDEYGHDSLGHDSNA